MNLRQAITNLVFETYPASADNSANDQADALFAACEGAATSNGGRADSSLWHALVMYTDDRIADIRAGKEPRGNPVVVQGIAKDVVRLYREACSEGPDTEVEAKRATSDQARISQLLADAGDKESRGAVFSRYYDAMQTAGKELLAPLEGKPYQGPEETEETDPTLPRVETFAPSEQLDADDKTGAEPAA